MRSSLTFLFICACSALSAYEVPAWWNIQEEATPLPPPFVLNLANLSDEDVAGLKSVPGVLEVSSNDSNRWHVVWQPFKPGPWKNNEKPRSRLDGFEQFHQYLAIKHAGDANSILVGRSLPFAHTVIPGTDRSEITAIDFDDKRGTHTMKIVGHVEPPPGLLVHEMVKDMVGLPIQVKPVGNGNVVICNTADGARVAWQVSDQYYIIIENSFDQEMVAAYIDRFGCVTPQDFSVDFDQWMETEIWWLCFNTRFFFPPYSRNPEKDIEDLWFLGNQMYRWQDVPRIFGSIVKETSPIEKWQWIVRARQFLWANKSNFKLDQDGHGFALKSADQFDPKQPPEFPAELPEPPKPEDNEHVGK